MIRFFKVSIFVVMTTFLHSCSNPLSFLFPKEKNNRNLELGLLAAIATNQQRLIEPRPFRGRSSHFDPDGAVRFYDWNLDRFLDQNFPVNLETNPRAWITNSGRMTNVITTNGRFQVLDSGLNLSPHGDHYHVDKTFPLDSMLNQSAIDFSNLQNPRTALSKGLWTAFATQAQIRFVEERKILSGQMADANASITNYTIPDGTPGLALPINSNKAIRMGAGSQVIFLNRTGSAWGLDSVPSGDRTCNNPTDPANHQVPLAGNDLRNVSADYTYSHTIVFGCSNKILSIRLQDGGSYSINNLQTASRVGYIIPTTKNQNYSRGGQNTKPIFVGNFGSNSETTVVRLDAETNTLQTFSVRPYRFDNLATETLEGKEILIFHNDNVLRVYDSTNMNSIREYSINDIAPNGNPKLYSDWEAAFVLYTSNANQSILQEYNVTERLPTRRIVLNFRPNALFFHQAVAKGTEYSGPLP